MTPDDLATAGRSLYGGRWQTSLARDLHVSDRTMRRWLAGHSPIPAHAEHQIRSVLLARFSKIDGMIDKGFAIQKEGANEELRHFHENVAPPEFTWAGSHPPRRAGPLYGFMRGSVVIPPDVDLTAPVIDGPFDVETGELPA